MTSRLAYFSHTCSLIFHLVFGLTYLCQPLMANNPPEAVDPAGLLSFPHLFSGMSTGPVQSQLTVLYLRVLGLFMLGIAYHLFRETFVWSSFPHTGQYGLLHCFYAMLCVGGFRNQWADLTTVWYFFCFHMVLTLGLIKIRREPIRVTPPDTFNSLVLPDDESDDSDYEPDGPDGLDGPSDEDHAEQEEANESENEE